MLSSGGPLIIRAANLNNYGHFSPDMQDEVEVLMGHNTKQFYSFLVGPLARIDQMQICCAAQKVLYT